MIQRNSDLERSPEVQDQLARITGFTDDLRQSVQGVRESKDGLAELHERLKEQHSNLYRDHVLTLKKRVSDGQSWLTKERNAQAEALGLLLHQTTEQVEILTRQLEEERSKHSGTLQDLEGRAGKALDDVGSQWTQIRTDNTHFRDHVSERMESVESRTCDCENLVQQARNALRDVEEASQQLDRDLVDARWRVSQLEANLQQQGEATQRQNRWHWVLQVVLALAVLYLIVA